MDKRADKLLRMLENHKLILKTDEGVIEDLSKNQYVRFILRILDIDLKHVQDALKHKDYSSLPKIVVKVLLRRNILKSLL